MSNIPSNEYAWVLEIPGQPQPLYYGPNRCAGYLTDVTTDHMRAVRFQRQEDAIVTADWLAYRNVNRADANPPRGFVPVQHGWHHHETTGCTAADYEEVLAGHRRLVRELDVALNGDGAAKQASLCDIVSQVVHHPDSLGKFVQRPAVETPASPIRHAFGVGTLEASAPKAGDVCPHCLNTWKPGLYGSPGVWHTCHTGPATQSKSSSPPSAAGAPSAEPSMSAPEGSEPATGGGGLNLACEKFVPEYMSNCCEECGYPERDHRSAQLKASALLCPKLGCVLPANHLESCSNDVGHDANGAPV